MIGDDPELREKIYEMAGDLKNISRVIQGSGAHDPGLVSRVEVLELDRAETKATVRTVKAIFGFLVIVGGPVFAGIVWTLHYFHVLPDAKG